MPPDLANQFNPSRCQADFTYAITPNTIEIQDTGKGRKAVADDLEAVLRKIDYCHQGSIAAYRISLQDAQGPEHVVEWHGKKSSSALKMCARPHNCKEVREYLE